MEIEDNSPDIERIPTGLYSLDHALINDRMEIGLPINVGYEWFGGTGIGKSTTVHSIAGLIASPPGVVLADFEGYDPKLLTSIYKGVGFDGKVKVLHEKEDEEQLDELLSALKLPEYSVGILDSVGAISSVGEQSGELGEANMGQRARILAPFTRKYMHLTRFTKAPKTMFLINHWYPKIGSRGYATPGGEVKNYICTVRILLRRTEVFPDGSYVLEGKVYKNRWGFGNRQFYVFILAGQGIHKGLTCMYDGILLGKVERKKTISIGDESMGYLKTIVQHAHDGDDKFFEPFVKAIADVTDVVDVTADTPQDFPEVED